MRTALDLIRLTGPMLSPDADGGGGGAASGGNQGGDAQGGASGATNATAGEGNAASNTSDAAGGAGRGAGAAGAHEETPATIEAGIRDALAGQGQEGDGTEEAADAGEAGDETAGGESASFIDSIAALSDADVALMLAANQLPAESLPAVPAQTHQAPAAPKAPAAAASETASPALKPVDIAAIDAKLKEIGDTDPNVAALGKTLLDVAAGFNALLETQNKAQEATKAAESKAREAAQVEAGMKTLEAISKIPNLDTSKYGDFANRSYTAKQLNECRRLETTAAAMLLQLERSKGADLTLEEVHATIARAYKAINPAKVAPSADPGKAKQAAAARSPIRTSTNQSSAPGRRTDGQMFDENRIKTPQDVERELRRLTANLQP